MQNRDVQLYSIMISIKRLIFNYFPSNHHFKTVNELWQFTSLWYSEFSK